MSQQRGLITYRTLGHMARCVDCGWQRVLDAHEAERRRVNNGNTAAANHARRRGHRVVVDIRREFNRRRANV